MDEMGVITIIFGLETQKEQWDRWQILKDEAALHKIEIARADLITVREAEEKEDAEFPLNWVTVRCNWEEVENLKFHMGLEQAYF